jgi:hypothetical protein
VGRLGFAGPTLSLDCKPEGPLAEALLVEDRQCDRLPRRPRAWPVACWACPAVHRAIPYNATCPFRKLYPRVAMVKSAQHSISDDDAAALDWPTIWSVLVNSEGASQKDHNAQNDSSRSHWLARSWVPRFVPLVDLLPTNRFGLFR